MLIDHNDNQKMDWDKCRVKPKKKFNLSKIKTDSGVKKVNKKSLKANLESDILKISNLQNKLYAEDRQSLLIIL